VLPQHKGSSYVRNPGFVPDSPVYEADDNRGYGNLYRSGLFVTRLSHFTDENQTAHRCLCLFEERKMQHTKYQAENLPPVSAECRAG